MAASNDVRGWIMSGVSGVACILGSAVICVDVLLRHFSRGKGFQIVNNNAFLSASLCLSAGVMLFTSLYSMLPTSKEYLTRAGWSPAAAAYSLIGLFLAGVIVIRFLSALLHRYIPSHVVGCAHSHEPDANSADPERGHGHHHAHHSEDHHGWTERTPLLARASKSSPAAPHAGSEAHSHSAVFPAGTWRVRLGRRLSRMVGVKTQCDKDGPCYGFSQTCGAECSKTLIAPEVSVADDTGIHTIPVSVDIERVDVPEEDLSVSNHTHHKLGDSSSSTPRNEMSEYLTSSAGDADGTSKTQVPGSQHHHHVPQNAFLSIGLQTSIAIALHKLPEGFITYATNHASPKLGLTVFLALFIHNISEGFAMALPLYLALQSRGKAIFWSSLLGGVSQPAGAGLAVLWIWGAGRTGSPGDDADSSWAVYGGMFAATAGVMTSVALQLFSEGLGLTHNRGMSIGFAIAGMGIMGLSFALTA
ncbi:zinc transporter [Aspergillus oryzae 100-8]|uniref:Zinc transporter n=2 Tax=Aspergillus oryzae TaxID=5062 RepID=I8A2U3_ASPO3|nr:zinc transporter [Aspergillus oryzae 3.042]KDE82436.1 zinc transporter [Aspergillus oryzae 100-8]|eukprot:EIT78719.1 zinc transporter [Aspergillus oryzae 3.042]